MSHPTMFCDGVIFSRVPVRECAYYAMPGVYMLCRREPDGSVTILYIGEATDIAARLGPDHEHWSDAMRLGMNEVHVHLLAKTVADRLAIETRLRRAYPTPLNAQSPERQRVGMLNALADRVPPPRNALADWTPPPGALGRRNGLLAHIGAEPEPSPLVRALMTRNGMLTRHPEPEPSALVRALKDRRGLLD